MTGINMEKDVIIKATELIRLLKFFRTVKTINLPRGMRCPLDIKEDDLNHYTLSQAILGLGLIRWNCIFCGEHFEE